MEKLRAMLFFLRKMATVEASFDVKIESIAVEIDPLDPDKAKQYVDKYIADAGWTPVEQDRMLSLHRQIDAVVAKNVVQ